MWGSARNGRVLLRIEDHDRQRCRPAFEASILEDLTWLGFTPDEPPVRQSERGPIYEAVLARLRADGRVYACGCSRSDVAAGAEPGPEIRYPGTCAARNLDESPNRGVRIRLEPSIERFIDLRHGPQEQQPSAQCGDLLARDRHRNWTYQFAATVDDHVQGITLVVRGDDLLASTGRQIQLARWLGRAEPPLFLHHPLVMKNGGQKLSKSDGDTGVADLRARGWSAKRVIGHAACLAGLVETPGEMSAAEALRLVS